MTVSLGVDAGCTLLEKKSSDKGDCGVVGAAIRIRLPRDETQFHVAQVQFTFCKQQKETQRLSNPL